MVTIDAFNIWSWQLGSSGQGVSTPRSSNVNHDFLPLIFCSPSPVFFGKKTAWLTEILIPFHPSARGGTSVRPEREGHLNNISPLENHLPNLPIGDTILLMLQKSIRRSPVEVGSLSHFLPGFWAPSKRWLGMGFLNHQQHVWWEVSEWTCWIYVWHLALW